MESQFYTKLSGKKGYKGVESWTKKVRIDIFKSEGVGAMESEMTGMLAVPFMC